MGLLGKLQGGVTGLVYGKDAGTDKKSFYECVDADMQGNEVRLDAFKGEVVVAVNVASK